MLNLDIEITNMDKMFDFDISVSNTEKTSLILNFECRKNMLNYDIRIYTKICRILRITYV